MRILLAALLALTCASALGQTAPASTPPSSNIVTASGTVPDEATKSAVLEELRKLYGAERVSDQIMVGGVVAPANWDQYVTKMITPELKQVSNGQVQIQGASINISGDVSNEAARQQVLSSLSTAFDSNYAIKQNLHIDGSAKQKVLDQALAHRVVQFESGSAVLTGSGRAVLDEMASAILKLNNQKIDIIGNTDDVGNRQSNIQLSLDRANAVKAYLTHKGIPAANLTVSGQGPDKPIADNATDAGRAQNRRIDFRISATP
ncbi:MAG: OmpA family protein [Rhodanobacter sp.]